MLDVRLVPPNTLVSFPHWDGYILRRTVTDRKCVSFVVFRPFPSFMDPTLTYVPPQVP